MPSLRLHLRRRDDGYTIVEMLVVMVVLPVMAAIVYQTLIHVLQSQRQIDERTQAVDQARTAIEQIDRQVRSGNVLYDPSLETLPMSLRIYTQSNGLQKCVQWQVDTTNHLLRTRSWDPTWWQGTGTVGAWHVVARDVTNTSSQPPFALQGPSASYGTRLVRADLFVRVSSQGGNAVEVSTQTSGRNTQYGYTPDSCSPVPSA